MQEVIAVRLSPKKYFELDQLRKEQGKSSTEILKPIIHNYIKNKRALKMQESEQTKFSRGFKLLFDPNKHFDRELFNFSKDTENIVGKYSNIPMRGQVYLPFSKRDLTISSDTGLIPAAHRPELSVIPYDNVFENLGIQIFVETSANSVDIPAITSAASIESSEGSGTTENNPTTSDINLQPKMASIFTQRSRTFQAQLSEVSLELLETEMQSRIMEKIGNMVFHGSGADGEPEGIFENSNVNELNCNSFDVTKAASMVKTSNDNKFNLNKKFAVATDVFETLSTREKATGQGKFMIERLSDGQFYLCGQPVFPTNALDAGSIAYGNWANIVVVLFGGALALSQKQSAITGKISIYTDVYFDVAVQNSANFVRNTDATFS